MKAKILDAEIAEEMDRNVGDEIDVEFLTDEDLDVSEDVGKTIKYAAFFPGALFSETWYLAEDEVELICEIPCDDGASCGRTVVKDGKCAVHAVLENLSIEEI